MQLLQHGARKGYHIEPKQSRVHAFAVHPSCVPQHRQQQSTTTDPCKHTAQPAGGHCTASVLTHRRKQHPAVCSAAPDANVTVQESLQGEIMQAATTILSCRGGDVEPRTHLMCLADYICSGPLLGAACITPQQVQQELPVWQKLGQQLALQLGFDHDNMDAIQR